MPVILVLATFLVFIAIDFFLSRKKVVPATATVAPAKPTLLSSASIEGIMVPDQLRFHPGHMWLHEERPGFSRVGADALALRVVGKIDKIEAPKVGRWVRQGQKAFTIWTAGEKVEWVSPVEGEVQEINQEALKDPSLIAKDPYGRGWLVKVNVPERETVERNLLPQSLVRAWMREEVHRVRAVQPELAAVAVMGSNQIVSGGHDQSWVKLTHELFLS
jgi:glycine cleavage system H protein